MNASPAATTLARTKRDVDLAAVGREIAVFLVATLFLALTARISVYLPFTPVPVSGQTLGVLLVGALYGPRRGALAVLGYIAEGCAGAPVFAGGASGLPVLFGPTGGYLVGFVPAAAIAGIFAAAGRPSWLRVAGAALASLVVYGLGVPWLGFVVGLPLGVAAAKGALPFLAGDTLKVVLAAAVIPAGAPLLRRVGLRPW